MSYRLSRYSGVEPTTLSCEEECSSDRPFWCRVADSPTSGDLRIMYYQTLQMYCTQGTSTRGSEESFATGRRDRVGTKAEKELTKLFERWLNSTTSVLRAAIFGGESVSRGSAALYSCS